LPLLPLVSAHTIFSNLHINGKDAGQTTGVRYKTTTPNNAPLEDLTSSSLACNVNGDAGVPNLLEVPAGANLTFEFKASLWDKSKPRLEPGHKGPCAVYLKKVDNALTAKGSGDGWFKIFEDGVDEKGAWCTTKLTPDGRLNVKLPEGLQSGEYLARPELLALHNALEGRPQFFTSCMQIKVSGTGNLVPESTVSIPGYIKKEDKSVTFNIYSGKTSSYTMPGPQI
ncbi:lytic polysaccharide monooxygenase, partial [Periconia macrospinosa]